MKVFLYNRTKDWQSKTYSVIAESQSDALEIITNESNTKSEDWYLIGERDSLTPGVVGWFWDDLSV